MSKQYVAGKGVCTKKINVKCKGRFYTVGGRFQRSQVTWRRNGQNDIHVKPQKHIPHV